MQLKTILNSIENDKNFVYLDARRGLGNAGDALSFPIFDSLGHDIVEWAKCLKIDPK